MALNDWRKMMREEAEEGELSKAVLARSFPQEIHLRSKANTRVHLIVDTKSGCIIHSQFSSVAWAAQLRALLSSQPKLTVQAESWPASAWYSVHFLMQHDSSRLRGIVGFSSVKCRY